jgi:hypothetical protein
MQARAAVRLPLLSNPSFYLHRTYLHIRLCIIPSINTYTHLPAYIPTTYRTNQTTHIAHMAIEDDRGRQPPTKAYTMDWTDSEDPPGREIQFRGGVFNIVSLDDEPISVLAANIAEYLEADVKRMKLWIKPKPGMLKYPFPETPLSEVLRPNTTIQLIATTNMEIKDLEQDISKIREKVRLRGGRTFSAAPAKTRDWKKIQEESTYTFHTIRPLSYLPNPEKSQRYLERLAADPGIKASMRKHKFSVGLLTEMNPAEHTTHESKTLGLNRNAGEVIELRLRTDRYDGYRDYKVIRKTLCHELSHNVWGPHDSNFWALTREIEKEVEANDWKHGGHKVSNNEFYEPNDTYDEDEHADHGAWTGGEYILGSTSSSQVDSAGLSRREIMARAAQSRLDKESAAKDQAEPEGSEGH